MAKQLIEKGIAPELEPNLDVLLQHLITAKKLHIPQGDKTLSFNLTTDDLQLLTTLQQNLRNNRQQDQTTLLTSLNQTYENLSFYKNNPAQAPKLEMSNETLKQLNIKNPAPQPQPQWQETKKGASEAWDSLKKVAVAGKDFTLNILKMTGQITRDLVQNAALSKKTISLADEKAINYLAQKKAPNAAALADLEQQKDNLELQQNKLDAQAAKYNTTSMGKFKSLMNAAENFGTVVKGLVNLLKLPLGFAKDVKNIIKNKYFNSDPYKDKMKALKQSQTQVQASVQEEAINLAAPEPKPEVKKEKSHLPKSPFHH
ncbi:MAG: hypothetical protein H2069_00965 [Legionella sp.]|nr:hypothetical protein [Legionella sp.]